MYIVDSVMQLHLLKNFRITFFSLRSSKQLCTQGLIEILGFMVIFDENQGVSDLSKYDFLSPIYVKFFKFLVI